MTQDKARKRKAREAARQAGKPYTLAARENEVLDPATGCISARLYAQALQSELQRQGEHIDDRDVWQDTEGYWTVMPEKMTVTVFRRAPAAGGLDMPGDPDDPKQFDPEWPVIVATSVPIYDENGHWYDLQRAHNTHEAPFDAVVAAIREDLATWRPTDLDD